MREKKSRKEKKGEKIERVIKRVITGIKKEEERERRG